MGRGLLPQRLARRPFLSFVPSSLSQTGLFISAVFYGIVKVEAIEFKP